MKRIIYIILALSFIAVLFTQCNTPKHTMSVAQIDRIAPIPAKVNIDTTHLSHTIPKPTPPKLTDPKDNFEQSYVALKEMLQGTTAPNFERAVYLSENPYHNNQYRYEDFQKSIDAQIYFIQQLINANDQSDTMNFDAYVGANGKFKLADMRYLPKEKKELYKKAVTNWSIFKFITDTVYAQWNHKNQNLIYYHPPFTYVTNDPFGKKDWSNTQVMNLLFSKEQKGNCFSLTALYKILANRLNSDARICTAPQHSYIQHQDNKGDYYNIELATAGFPRDGTIQTLTHTTSTAIKSGIALRNYTEQQSIGLCLINLAKSYEHYYETKDDDFILKCAETVLQYDSLNLSALLLKQQVLDERVTKYATQKNTNNIALLKQDNNIQQTLIDLQTHLQLLYRLGYRQMPLDMQQIIMSGNYPESGYADKNPSPFTTIKPKEEESKTYRTISYGLFQEVYTEQPTENYGHFVLDAKTKQLKTIDTKAQDNFLIDPVAFAYDFGARMYDARLGRFTSTDPLSGKFPWQSPYTFAGNRPIISIDVKGLAEKTVIYNLGFRESDKSFYVQSVDVSIDPNSNWIKFNEKNEPVSFSLTNIYYQYAGVSSLKQFYTEENQKDGMKPSALYDYSNDEIPNKQSNDIEYAGANPLKWVKLLWRDLKAPDNTLSVSDVTELMSILMLQFGLNSQFKALNVGSNTRYIASNTNVTFEGVTANRVLLGSSNKVAVIGRNMERVETFAKNINGKTWGGFNANLSEAENLANNKKWIQGLLDEGYTIYDVGLDPAWVAKGSLEKGAYYGMETKLVFGDK